MEGSIAPFYADWARYNRRIIDGLRDRPADDLALRAGPDHGPVWALAAHIAGARTYWLCVVFGEPGAEQTPFADPSADGWEDDLSVPRSADELVWAFESTWRVIEGCLERWTPDSLGVEVRRELGGRVQVHTRQSVLLRLITHEAFHAGEISQVLGVNGRTPLDLWRPLPPAP